MIESTMTESIMMDEKKRNIKDYIDALVDDEGLKTEVTITLTSETLWKIIGGLVLTGATITLIAQLLKNLFPNRQLEENNQLLMNIKNTLKKT